MRRTVVPTPASLPDNDTDAEEVLDDLVKLAALICDVPISLVSLIDRHRQWFKARHGLEATETPRDLVRG